MNKDNVLNNLFNIIEARKDKPIEGSYTGYLFEKGLDKILKKVGEESSEVIIAAKNEDKEELIKEICDLTYHIMVLMAEKQIKLDGIEKELEKRREKICNKKNERKTIERL
ncbi:TPA: phosphoribosyl-ATP diphosphatase [Clostridium botulinum]|uniref:Phosphoribosyl-ATP pyrophosphatase n=1 Tax=Clostridium botulinum B str. Osaka05 TaxID=1407017 RepID=A0A0S6U7A8_CLOBO|nr:MULTISPECIES: phosphoribosyl-ATP diphosphatase [Clostridium]EJE7235068.1 phosphoribosyl-ATP diphosphatase [Clostridium botulinum]MBU5298547.1 phosphoribosyl-ATP diphosphatase [Clostridium sporogenes]NFE81456.1 phosphoribosyl-ATP diphosphatase [Clostridium sporogenes]NFG67730.1 phosphoribosyl-ATP diphosphatase [Clostridium sporogenes]GAE02119.1 phosphoribosyl-ATP pyrophosphatase [Clostridium botulinum B str. Osaka05]